MASQRISKASSMSSSYRQSSNLTETRTNPIHPQTEPNPTQKPSTNAMHATPASSNSPADAWDRVKRRLRAELGEDVFSSWFGRLDLVEIADETAHLSVPTRFLKSWIENHYIAKLTKIAGAEFTGLSTVQVRVRVQGTAAQSSTVPRAVIPGERRYRDGDRVRHARWGDPGTGGQAGALRQGGPVRRGRHHPAARRPCRRRTRSPSRSAAPCCRAVSRCSSSSRRNSSMLARTAGSRSPSRSA